MIRFSFRPLAGFLVMMIAVLFSMPAVQAESYSTKYSQSAQTEAPDAAPDMYATIDIIPEKTDIKAGETLYVAIKQQIHPGWHTYWKNPGDSGEPTHVNWILPDGFEAGTLMFPTPKPIAYPPLTNYGYEGTVYFLQTITAPPVLSDGPVRLTAAVDWLVCKEICIPESVEKEVIFNAGGADAAAEDAGLDVVTQALNKMPVSFDWDAHYKEVDGMFVLDIDVTHPKFLGMFGQTVHLDILPVEWGVIENGAEIYTQYRTKNDLQITKARGDRALDELGAFEVVLTIDNEEQGRSAASIIAKPDPAWLASVQGTESGKAAMQHGENAGRAAGAQSGQNAAAENGAKNDAENGTDMSLAFALGFAFLGGIILNLMPCVFPILSMKALSLCKMAEKENAHARAYGLSYTCGILLGFFVFATILIVLKSLGGDIGWGFHLQNPLVVFGLAWLLFVIGLNLSGLFEIPGSFSNVGGGLARKEGLAGSFFTGLLAVLVATPCTAPFMGAAIGFALLQPPSVAVTVFLMLGLGLAFPFLLISFVPPLQKILPKPGHWMITFREFLAFPIYGSVIWLVWVLTQQVGSVGVLWSLIVMAVTAFVIWLFRSTTGQSAAHILLRFIGLLVLLLSFVTAGLILSMPSAASLTGGEQTPQTAAPLHAEAEAYTPEALAGYLETDRPVFVNMTADWCITCKVNERVALNRDDVKALFSTHDVAYLKGDWTKRDETITAFLERYGRNGVPLYIFYGQRDSETGDRPDPVILPQLLTQSKVKALFE